MDVTAHEGLEALESLKPEWDALLQSCARPNPFVTHEWIAASWKHHGDGDRPVTVCVRDGGRLVGLAALRAKRARGARQLLFAAAHADAPDLLMADGLEWAVLEAFCGWLAKDCPDWDLVRLRGVSSRSQTDQLLPVVAREAGLAACAWRVETAPYVLLPSTREEYYAQMPSGSRRRELLRRRRRLEEQHGEVAIRLDAGADVTPEAMARLLTLHRHSWEGRGGSDVLTDHRVEQFHTETAVALAPKGVSQVGWLVAGGREVAGWYGFLVGQTYLAYILGHDPDFARFSPGAQVSLALIEHGIDDGWREIDLMRGAEPYKFDFTRRCAYTMDHALARTRTKLRLFATVAAYRGRLLG
jgi:CelD/BcsL family acetyltransferase involved in cellulose biosynthesis